MKATILKVRAADTIRVQIDSETHVEIQVKKVGKDRATVCVLRPDNTTVKYEKSQEKGEKAK